MYNFAETKSIFVEKQDPFIIKKSQRNSSHWKYFCRNLKKIHSCYQVKIDSVTLEFKTKYICNTSMDIVKYKYKVVIIDDDGYTNLPCL